MGSKVKQIDHIILFYCPGCRFPHQISVAPGGWTWNGNAEAPNIHPSVDCSRSIPEDHCHFFVRDGRIEFLNDCHHGLKGMTVDMVDWDAWGEHRETDEHEHRD